MKIIGGIDIKTSSAINSIKSPKCLLIGSKIKENVSVNQSVTASVASAICISGYKI